MWMYLAQTDGGNTSQQWIAIAVGIVGLAYLLLRPKLGRKKRDPLESMPRASLSQQRSLERDMNNLVVELSEMARQISAQLDTRAAKLELLIKEADRKIAELDRLGGKSGGGYSPDSDASGVADRNAPASAEPDPSADLRHSDVYALADAGHSAHDIAQRLDRPSGEIELILALRSSASHR